jgi:hypothetical protein
MTYFRIKGDDEGHGILNTPTSTEYDSYHESMGAHAPQPKPPNPNKRPWTDPDFVRDYRANLEEPQSPRPAPPKRPKYEDQVWHVQQLNPRPSKPGYLDPGTLDPGYEYEIWHLPSLADPKMVPADEYFKTWKVPILESSEVYPSSNSVPAGSDLESTTVVQAPAPSRPLPERYSYFNTWKQPIPESSDVHASSSLTPPGTDDGSTNVMQAPAPNPESSTANPDALLEPTGSSAGMQGPWEDRFIVAWDDVFSNKGDDDEVHRILHALTSTDYDPDHELTGSHVLPWTDPDFNWDYWTSS